MQGVFSWFGVSLGAASVGCGWCVRGACCSPPARWPSRDPDPFSVAGSNTSLNPVYRTNGATLLLTVKADNKTRLGRQPVVKLRNTWTGDTLWQTTTDRSEAAFGDLQVAPYEIEISAVGYLTFREPFKVQTAVGAYQKEIVLQSDPSSIELNAHHASQLPKKVHKAILRGVAALKSGNHRVAEKELGAARKMAPDSADVNFLSGYLAVQQKHLDEAKTYLRTATKLDPGNSQAFILLGPDQSASGRLQGCPSRPGAGQLGRSARLGAAPSAG